MSVLNAKIKIIYIAGYGFSGSTLLERMIAAHPQIVGCGETHNLLHDFYINETCSCGVSLTACPHWKNVYTQYLKNKNSINNLNVFSVIAEDENPQVLYFCDSSKTTLGNMMRPYSLAKKYDLTLIHLSRNGVDCLHSVLKRSTNSSSLMKSSMVAIHWSMANLTAYAFKFFKSSAYYKITYEDLIKNPSKQISEVYRFLNATSQNKLKSFNQKSTIPRTHQLSGNAMRRVEDLVLNRTSKTDEKQTFLPLPSLIFKILSFPIYKLMGY